MKLAERKYNVTIDTDNPVRNFGIMDNAKMFSILSDGLYNDKIMAIIRELSANAWDSHRDNGNTDQPFDIHLPTWSEPEFWIRDYGVGMSDDKIDEVYLWYGGSDKSDSNDNIGCLGLGSKTPFCYNTRTFTVDSWHNGWHRTYSAFFGEDGKPKIIMTSEELSNEPSGIKVTVPVRSCDRSEFKNKLVKNFLYYKVKPNVVNESIRFSRVDHTVKGDGWAMRSQDQEGPRMIMGQVYYPIKLMSESLTDAQKTVLNNADIDIYASIGQVDIDASREGLSYNNKTINYLKMRSNSFISTIMSKFQKEIDTASNLFEARLKFQAMFSKSDSITRSFVDVDKLTYDGKKLELVVDFKELIDKYSVYNLRRYFIKHHCQFFNFVSDYGRLAQKERIISFRPSTRKEYAFFFNDMRIGAFVRCQHVANNLGKNVILISKEGFIDLKEIVDIIGVDVEQIKPISSIPSPTVRNNKTRTKTTKLIRFSTNGRLSRISHYWHNVDIEKDIETMPGSNVYLEFNNYYIQNDGRGKFNPHTIATKISLLKSNGISIPVIWGIKKQYLKKVKNSSNWIDFFTWANQELAKKFGVHNFEECQYYKDQLYRICKGYNGQFNIKQLEQLSDRLKEDHYLIVKLYKGVQYAQNITKNVPNITNIKSLLDYFDVKVKENKKFKKICLTDLESLVYSKYKVLNMIDFRSSRFNYDDIVNYIKLVEGEK